MFSGTGFQVQGGTFYNVGGDLNLQTHQHQHLDIQSLSAQNLLSLEDSRCRGVHGDLIIDDGGLRPHDPDDSAGDTELGFARVARNPHLHSNARQTPYNAAARPDRLMNSTNDEALPESSSPPSQRMGDPYAEPLTVHNPIYIPHSFDGHSFHPSFHYLPSNPPSSRGGIHITAQNVHNRQGESGVNILHRSVALEALYDSADSFPQPKCHPETRTEMLDNLYNWCTEDVTEHPICWLQGPAGAGKSAIMQTLSRRLQDAGRLGGAFFFKRHHFTRGNAKVLFATLDYQLALNNRDAKPLISDSLEVDPSIVAREMDVQLQKLIIEPCQSLTNSQPVTLLLDGLDECQDERIQQQILRLIEHTMCQCRTGIRVLVASRPESHIRDIVEKSSFDKLLNSVNVQQSFDDVRKYFLDEFERIFREHPQTMREVQTPWPSPEILKDLVEKSSGYFVYASTIIKFVDDPYFRPTERLEIVQNLKPAQYDAPFETLDQLYIQILSGVPPQFHPRLLDILQCVASSVRLNPLEVDYFLGLQPGDARLILRGLHSVLKVPTDDGWAQDICFHHASFQDFLQAQKRSLSFHLSVENRMNITRAVLTASSDEGGWLGPKSPHWLTHFGLLVQCITSVPPSPELVPFIERISPDCIWMTRKRVHDVKPEEVLQVSAWLKTIQPPPTDETPLRNLIQRWDTYHKMALWENIPRQVFQLIRDNKPGLSQSLVSLSPQMLHVLNTNMPSSLRHPVAEYWPLVAQSFKCIRILQVAWLVNSCTVPFARGHSTSLYCLRPLLNESWDGMMDSISVLPTIISGEKANTHLTAIMMTVLTLSLEFFPASAPTVSGDLACSCLRLIKEGPPQLPSQLAECWGKLIRCSPHSNPELLGTLREFTPPWNECEKDWKLSEPYPLHPVNFHDVLQWLNAHPEKHPEIITRWQSYLDKSISVYPFSDVDVSTTNFEAEWREILKYTVDFNATPHGLPYMPLDEEVIRSFQHILETLLEEE